MHPDFSAAKLGKKSSQITQVNMVCCSYWVGSPLHGSTWEQHLLCKDKVLCWACGYNLPGYQYRSRCPM
jgi:hypothetical protein